MSSLSSQVEMVTFYSNIKECSVNITEPNLSFLKKYSHIEKLTLQTTILKAHKLVCLDTLPHLPHLRELTIGIIGLCAYGYATKEKKLFLQMLAKKIHVSLKQLPQLQTLVFTGYLSDTRYICRF